MGQDYSGDVTAREAWDLLKTSQDATLVDVRTRAEWSFVGVPDLTDLGKEVVFIEWQSFPERERNPQFVDALTAELKRRGVDPDAPLLFICRSGGRSASAARAVTASGRGQCYNVAGGFEGGLDGERHRGRRSGWKAENLPWVQT